MKRCTRCLILPALLCLLISCTHKELCFHHPHTTPVRVNVDWSKFESYEQPTGMTLVLYPEGTIDKATRDEINESGTTASSGGVVTHLTNTVSHADLNLPVNNYHVLVFNQSTTEFGSFQFRDMEGAESAVVVMQYHSRWYSTRDGEDNVAESPEWLGVGNADDAQVTQAMLDAETDRVMYGERQMPEIPVIAEVTPHNIIYTVNVRINVENIYNYRAARASITGMSEGYRLTREQRLSTEVTHLIEQWSMKQDAAAPTKGYIEGSFTCFGLPCDHAATAGENLLSLEVLLVDNKTIERFDFEVGDRFVVDQSDPNSMTLSVEITTPVRLSDVKPEEGSGFGFDVTVDDWGEEENQDIQM